MNIQKWSNKKKGFLVFVIGSLLGYILGCFMHSEFWHFFANLFGG